MTIKAILFDLDDTLLDTGSSREERARRVHRRLADEGVQIRWGAFWRNVNSLDAGGFYSKGVEGAIRDLGLNGTAIAAECASIWGFVGAEDLLVHSHSCIETLDKLSAEYRLAVVTNGPGDSQRHKLAHTGLEGYFELILPSGELGVAKPDPRILQLALQRLDLEPDEAVFVGDHLDLDVICAHDAGMRGIWYNPHHHRRHMHPFITPDAMIRSLVELPGVLEKLEQA